MFILLSVSVNVKCEWPALMGEYQSQWNNSANDNVNVNILNAKTKDRWKDIKWVEWNDKMERIWNQRYQISIGLIHMNQLKILWMK